MEGFVLNYHTRHYNLGFITGGAINYAEIYADYGVILEHDEMSHYTSKINGQSKINEQYINGKIIRISAEDLLSQFPFCEVFYDRFCADPDRASPVFRVLVLANDDLLNANVAQIMRNRGPAFDRIFTFINYSEPDEIKEPYYHITFSSGIKITKKQHKLIRYLPTAEQIHYFKAAEYKEKVMDELDYLIDFNVPLTMNLITRIIPNFQIGKSALIWADRPETRIFGHGHKIFVNS
jgi:hypothetical protein